LRRYLSPLKQLIITLTSGLLDTILF